MRILVKYPTRQRPELFLKNLADYYQKTTDKSNVTFLVSCDLDDITMGEEVLSKARGIVPNIIIERGHSDSKIHACNRDIEKVSDWDVVLLVSDDMFCQTHGWDSLIRNEMSQHFPDTDGCIWFHDGSTQRRISTLSCIGRKYYDRFGYIYQRDYKSFFCDNEYTDIAMSLGKIHFTEKIIAKHEHPHWGGNMTHDALYIRNEVHWKKDEELYNSRKLINFGL